MQPAWAGARIAAMLVAERYNGRVESGWKPSGATYAAVALLSLAALVVWLLALGRPLICDCGTVRLWAPGDDSQHFSDWYSWLHLSFGLGLFLLVTHFQPRWPLAPKLFIAVIGSVAWEAIENLPGVIALFNPPGEQGSYRGDTVLNALGDTGFVLAGAALAARLSTRAIVLLAVLIEVAVWLAIRDGLVVGSAKLAFGG